MTEKIENLAKTFIKGGSTGVIIALIAFLAYNNWNHTKIMEMNNTLVGNHIDHSTMAIDKQADSNVAIAEALTELSTIIQITR